MIKDPFCIYYYTKNIKCMRCRTYDTYFCNKHEYLTILDQTYKLKIGQCSKCKKYRTLPHNKYCETCGKNKSKTLHHNK